MFVVFYECVDVNVPITMDGSPSGHDTSYTFPRLTGTHNFTIPIQDANGHPFSNWNTGQTNMTIAISSGGAYTAYYEMAPPPTYNATINAYCNTEATNVSVAITEDGSPTGHLTPYTFSSLTGSHTFTVPDTDQNGHAFSQWNTGRTITTITISSGGTYTANYQALIYNITVFAHCTTEGMDIAVPITEDGSSTGHNTPYPFNNLSGTYTFSVPNKDASGHPFKQWNTGQTSTAIDISSGGAYTAYYGAAPPPTYSVTIGAYDNTAGTNVGVMITEDGSPAGFGTPHTFPGLTGTHNFTIPAQDASGNPFKNWNTGVNNTTISVSSAGSYTAHYEALPPPSVKNIEVTPTFSTIKIGNMIFFNGNVTDQYRNGVPNVTVGIDDSMAQQSTSKTTDAKGAFGYISTPTKNGAFLVSFFIGSLRTSSIVDVGITCTFSAFSQIAIKNPYDTPITAVLSVDGQEQFREDIPKDETTTKLKFENYFPIVMSGAYEACPIQWPDGSYCIDSSGTASMTVGEVLQVQGYKQASTGDVGYCVGLGAQIYYVHKGSGLICAGQDGVHLDFSLDEGTVGSTITISILSTSQSSKNVQFSAHSPVSLLVTDPTGKRIGFDPHIGLVDEIVWASYTGPSTGPQMINIPNLMAGEYTVSVFGLEDGNYSISTEGILANGITESSQWINGTILKGQMLVAFANDAQVSYAVGVTPLKSAIGQGYSIPMNLTIMNTGFSTEDFNVTLCANSTILDTELIHALLNGTSTTIICAWNTSSLSFGDYTLNVYAEAILGENGTAENNFTVNVVTVTIPGDIDGDGTVFLSDLGLMATAWGSTPTSPNWNPNADIIGEGQVFLGSLAVMAAHWTEGWTPP